MSLFLKHTHSRTQRASWMRPTLQPDLVSGSSEEHIHTSKERKKRWGEKESIALDSIFCFVFLSRNAGVWSERVLLSVACRMHSYSVMV